MPLRHAVTGALVVPFFVGAVVGCSAPAPITVELVEVTPGPLPAIKLHVKGKAGSFLTCTAGELQCESNAITASGPAEIVVKLEPGKAVPDAITVFSFATSARTGKFTSAVLDLKKTPQIIDTSTGGYATTQGIGRKCDAILSWGPNEKVMVTTEVGASVDVGGINAKADSGGLVVAPVKAFASKAFGDLPIEQTFVGDDNADRGSVPLTVTFADGVKLSITLHLTANMAKRAVEEFFKGVEKGPTLLPGEVDGKPAPGAHAAYSLRDHKVLGKQVHAFREIEYVADESDSGTRSFTCKYQSGATAALTMNDATVKLYERRTGHVAFTHVFNAAEQCDESVDHTEGTAMPPQNSYVSAATIDAWVSKELGH